MLQLLFSRLPFQFHMNQMYIIKTINLSVTMYSCVQMFMCSLVHMFVDVHEGQIPTLTLIPRVRPNLFAETRYFIDLSPLSQPG